MLQNRKFLFGVLTVCLLIVLGGCADLLNKKNGAPHILKVVSSVFIGKNSSVTLSLEFMEAYDMDGDPVSLIVYEGEHYTLLGSEVTPLLNYVGELKVPIQLQDSTGLYSPVDTLIINVTEEEIVSILPLRHGTLWDYTDTFFVLDSVGSSTLLCQRCTLPDSIETIANLYSLSWERSSGPVISYLYENRPLGLYQVGALSAVDTLLSGQYKLRYPALIDESWEYRPIQAKVKSGFLYQDSSAVDIYVVSDLTYVAVPAGVFQCTQYEYRYTRTGQLERNSIPEDIHVSDFRSTACRNGEIVRVVLSYAPGIGCVQSETYIDDNLIVKKSLRSYKNPGEL